jgi:hypothetical protein
MNHRPRPYTYSHDLCSCLNHIKVIRRFFPEPFHRNVLGGCLFVIAKVMNSYMYLQYAVGYNLKPLHYRILQI